MVSISVVITCYNLAGYIALAIESVLRQNYKGSFQVIVVDDASTDRSLDVIRRYHSLEVIQSASNVGVLLATISGLRRCKGDVVFFLDGDDVWNPSKLTSCIQPFEEDPGCCLVTHDINFITGAGQPLAYRSRPGEVLSKNDNPGKAVRKGILEQDDYVWLGSAYGVHRLNAKIDAFCDWAERLPQPQITYQDWPLAFWVASLDNARCAYVDKILMSYRIHAKNHSGSGSSVPKLLSNLEKGLYTSESIMELSRLRSMEGMIAWIALAKRNHYAYLILLYRRETLAAIKKFLSIQAFLSMSPTLIIKEWIRLFLCVILGVERCTGISAQWNQYWLRSR